MSLIDLSLSTNYPEYFRLKSEGALPKKRMVMCCVYSDKYFAEEVEIELHECRVLLSRYDRSSSDEWIGGYLPSFECKAVFEDVTKFQGDIEDIAYALGQFMPLLQWDYALPRNCSVAEEINDSWYRVPKITTYATVSSSQPNYNANIQSQIRILNRAHYSHDKRSKKAINLRRIFGEAIRLANISGKYCFLQYYNVIEIVADDFISNEINPSESSIAAELLKNGLLSKISQRMKIYFLTKAISSGYSLDDALEIADFRNKITHSIEHPTQQIINKCQRLAKISFDAFLASLD